MSATTNDLTSTGGKDADTATGIVVVLVDTLRKHLFGSPLNAGPMSENRVA